MRGHGRAAELTPNRLNQGFSRTLAIRCLILAWGITGRRMEGTWRRRSKGGREGGEGFSREKKKKLRVQSGISGRGDGLVSDTVQLR